VHHPHWDTCHNGAQGFVCSVHTRGPPNKCDPFLSALLQLVIMVQTITNKQSLQVEEEMKVCKEAGLGWGEWSNSSYFNEASSWHVSAAVCGGMLSCKNTTPTLSMLRLLFCIAGHNLLRVSQYTLALNVMLHGRNWTKKVPCLSHNMVHMIFLVHIVFCSPPVLTAHTKPCAPLRQVGSVGSAYIKT
jgi:hypothetical protein